MRIEIPESRDIEGLSESLTEAVKCDHLASLEDDEQRHLKIIADDAL